jgi:signal transduction histidine kinase
MTTKRGASVISFVAELLKYPQEYLRMVKKTDQDPSVVRVDILELKSGRYIERHSYPRLVKNKITGRVMSFRDISESRNAEERLRQSERQLRALTARAESVREEESTRIAREIHDELGQSLTGLKMDIKWIEKHLESSQKPLRERAVQMSELIDGTIQTIRKIATELRPSILDSLGFLPAIEWQADEFQDRTGIECTLAPPEKNLHFSKEQSIGLFRIFQETLTNIARHADATRVEVRFIEDRDHFVFSVHDDGKGITDKDLANPNSLGILGMTERARLFGGELTVEGKRGAGTCVSVRVPLNHGKVERAR